MKRRRRAERTETHERRTREDSTFVHHLVEDISMPVTYRKQRINSYKSSDPAYMMRRYFVGAVQVAIMYIYEMNTQAAGNVCVHIPSKPTGGGNWFKKKSEAQRMILDELQRTPQ